MNIGTIIIIAIAASGVLMMRFRKRWLAKINIAFTNRITSLFAGWLPGFGILRHVGRKRSAYNSASRRSEARAVVRKIQPEDQEVLDGGILLTRRHKNQVLSETRLWARVLRRCKRCKTEVAVRI